MRKIVFLACLSLLLHSFTQKKLKWIAIGDSITYLNDHLDETGNRVTKGYLSRVVAQLPNIHYINQGHNGWTSEGIAASIDKLGLEQADIYSIFLGTNDWWQGRPIGNLTDYTNNTGNTTVYGSFRIIINKIRELNQHAQIILITPMQRADFVYFNGMKNNAYGSYREKNGQSLSLFAAAIKAIGAQEHFAVVDLYNNKNLSIEKLVKFKRLRIPQMTQYRNYPYPDYIDIPFHPDNDEYPYPLDAVDMTYDGLHPSDKGNAEIARCLVQVLKKS